VIDSRFMTRRNGVRRAAYVAVSFILSLSGPRSSLPQESSSIALPETEIRSLANHILQKAGKADCKPRDCTILVANFSLPTGATSRLGMQIADQVSKELTSQQNPIKMIDRSHLQSFLEEQRIPGDLLNNKKAICWLGKQLGATAILTAVTEDEGESVRVQLNLRSCDTGKTGPTEVFTFPYSGSKADLSPVAPNPKTASAGNDSANPAMFRAGMGGAGAPACLYCPGPSYTKPARAARFHGKVLLDVVVSANGDVKSATILQGVPFGLNDNAMEAVRQWKFKPATRDGQPVPVMVMIEVAFSLYPGGPA
jgi:TonB family protein